MHDGERELLLAASAGDGRARRELFEHVASRVHAVASRFFGRDRATASDVTQEILLKLLGRIDSFRGDSALGTWLHRVTVNACLDETRSRRRLVALDAIDAGPEPAARDDQAAASEDAQRDALVQAAVARLPEKLRIAVLLRHFEDLSYEQMAEALGCSPGTVASRLSRGHAQLARELRALRGDAISGHPLDLLDAHAAGTLGAPDEAYVSAHLRDCDSCRQEAELVREGRDALRALARVPPPALPEAAAAWERAPARPQARRGRPARTALLIAAAALLFGAVLVASWWRTGRPLVASGEMREVEGGAAVTVLQRGVAVEAGAETARLQLGRFGHVDLSPGTRVVRLSSAPVPMWLGLQRGTLRAVITAPPRMVVVETPHARAVDLGCAYEIVVFEDGQGSLRVDTGAVELRRAERSVVVPGGFSCEILAGLGPAAPVRKGAPALLAVAARRAAREGIAPPPEALAAAERGDALTLLALLELVPRESRPAVRERLAAHVPLPLSVTLDDIDALSPPALLAWRDAISPSP